MLLELRSRSKEALLSNFIYNLELIEENYKNARFGYSVDQSSDGIEYMRIIDALEIGNNNENLTIECVTSYKGDFGLLLSEIGLYEELSSKWGIFNYDSEKDAGILVNDSPETRAFGKFLTYEILVHRAQKRIIDNRKEFIKTKVSLINMHTLFVEFLIDLIRHHKSIEPGSIYSKTYEALIDYYYEHVSGLDKVVTRNKLIYIGIEREVLVYSKGIFLEEYFELLPKEYSETMGMTVNQKIKFGADVVLKYIEEYTEITKGIVACL